MPSVYFDKMQATLNVKVQMKKIQCTDKFKEKSYQQIGLKLYKITAKKKEVLNNTKRIAKSQ